MTALLGVDALFRAEGDGEGLAVVNLDTSGAYAADPFASYADARRCFEALRADAALLPEADRRAYYDQLCHSTLAFITWRERGLSFERQLRDFLHVDAQPVPDAELDLLQAEMRTLLDGMGYSGDLRTQCAAWEERNRVPAEAVPEVTCELLSAAWDRTEERLMKIPASKDDGMRLTPVTGVAFNARCDYLHRSIELNTEPILTRPGLKHLAVHEGYPGHYVQFKLRETMARNGEAPADVLLSVVNTASSSVFEGLGDAGIAMLDWMESDDDRFQSVMNRYRAGIGTGAAWRLHALGWPSERVADWLRSRSLVGGEGWVQNRIRFFAAPARAVLIWSYWWGEPTVAAAWNAVARERRPEFLRYLHGRMHSNTTVGMFA
jgi:hypothetical protein